MKEKVLEVMRNRNLKPHEKFNQAMQLLRQSKGVNPVALRNYNQLGPSSEAVKNLFYDLQQLHGISDAELRAKPKKEKKQEKEGLPEDLAKQLKEMNIPEANYHKELRPLALDIAEFLNVELENQKTETLESFLMKQKMSLLDDTQEAHAAVFSEASQDAKEGLKLREEFPFLNEEDCPDKIKILVADKLTAFQKVVDAREDLFKNERGEIKLTTQEIVEKCKAAVENFELNGLIYDELNYYKENKEILGNHPIFEDEMAKRKVDEMSDNDAHQAYRNLATYISKEKKQLENAKSDESRKVIEDKIKEYEVTRALIAEKLGLNEKK